jgi:ribosomal protein S6
MAKKLDKNEIQVFIRGKSSSVEEVAIHGGYDTWKSYLETADLHHSESGDRYLKEKLGDYRSGHYLHTKIGIEPSKLEKLRKTGKISAEKLKGRWYYSVESLIENLKIVIR